MNSFLIFLINKLGINYRAYRSGESHWVHDGLVLDPLTLNSGYSIIETYKSRILVIDKATPADSGEYVCVTSNNFGVASVGARVIVSSNAPKQKPMPKFIRALEKRFEIK